jgi:hypothetical protein
MTPDKLYATIPVPEANYLLNRDAILATALAVGSSVKDAIAPYPGSQARADDAEALSFLRDSLGEIKRLAGQLATEQAAHRLDMLNDITARMDSLGARLDRHIAKRQKREAERQQKIREDALRAELAAALDAIGAAGEFPTFDPDRDDPNLEKPNEEPEEYSRHGYDSAPARDLPAMVK